MLFFVCQQSRPSFDIIDFSARKHHLRSLKVPNFGFLAFLALWICLKKFLSPFFKNFVSGFVSKRNKVNLLTTIFHSKTVAKGRPQWFFSTALCGVFWKMFSFHQSVTLWFFVTFRWLKNFSSTNLQPWEREFWLVFSKMSDFTIFQSKN